MFFLVLANILLSRLTFCVILQTFSTFSVSPTFNRRICLSVCQIFNMFSDCLFFSFLIWNCFAPLHSLSLIFTIFDRLFNWPGPALLCVNIVSWRAEGAEASTVKLRHGSTRDYVACTVSFLSNLGGPDRLWFLWSWSGSFLYALCVTSRVSAVLWDSVHQHRIS